MSQRSGSARVSAVCHCAHVSGGGDGQGGRTHLILTTQEARDPNAEHVSMEHVGKDWATTTAAAKKMRQR